MPDPALSIIMPCYNSGKYIGPAIESILSQSFRDFELIIVDDASTDETLGKVHDFNDQRIIILSNEENLGIVFSRNKGLKSARGRFIAPFDSDDIALPGKFEKQIRFLEQHFDYGMIGCRVKLINEEGKKLHEQWKLNADVRKIPSVLLFRNYFCHSAVIMRRECIPEGGYAVDFSTGEDYRMWIEIVRFWKAWNYPEYLVKYRLHKGSYSSKRGSEILQNDEKIFRLLFEPLGIEPNLEQIETLRVIKDRSSITDLETLRKIESFLLLVISRNKHTHVYDQKELSGVALNRWLKVCKMSIGMNISAAGIFLKSGLLINYLIPYHGQQTKS